MKDKQLEGRVEGYLLEVYFQYPQVSLLPHGPFVCQYALQSVKFTLQV